jgi:hypothetical protein
MYGRSGRFPASPVVDRTLWPKLLRTRRRERNDPGSIECWGHHPTSGDSLLNKRRCQWRLILTACLRLQTSGDGLVVAGSCLVPERVSAGCRASARSGVTTCIRQLSPDCYARRSSTLVDSTATDLVAPRDVGAPERVWPQLRQIATRRLGGWWRASRTPEGVANSEHCEYSEKRCDKSPVAAAKPGFLIAPDCGRSSKRGGPRNCEKPARFAPPGQPNVGLSGVRFQVRRVSTSPNATGHGPEEAKTMAR